MNRRNLVLFFIILIVVYLWLSLSAPVDTEAVERFHITAGELTRLRLTITLPVIGIWLLALYGFLRLLDYAKSIKGAPESGPLRLIGKGLMILAFGLPIASIAASIASTQGNSNETLLPLATVAKNYFQLIFPLIAFSYIAVGAEQLAATVRIKHKMRQEKLISFIFILVSSVYTAFIISNPFTEVPISDLYFIPTWLVVVTIVVPYLFTWFNGLTAGYYILKYKNHVKGHLYKHAFGRLALGLIVITIVAIMIRIFTTLNEQLTQLELSPLLMIVYALVLLYGLGYALVASGSKKLTKLEEV